MMRTAVIGLSDSGIEHARAYAAHPDVELVGVHSALDTALASELAAELGTRAFDSVAGILDAGIDLCSVRVPLVERAEIIATLLDAGVHVLSELPLSSDPKTLDGLRRRARSRGVVLAGDLPLRFTPAVSRALQWVREGAIGTPLFMNMSLYSNGLDSGDAYELFRGLGGHAVDLMRLFCGDVERVQCFGVRPSEHAAWSNAQVNMHFADSLDGASGAVATLTLSSDMSLRHPIARLELAGAAARLTIENVYEEATLFVHTDEEKRVVTNSIFGGMPQLRDSHAARISRLVEQIQNGDDIELIEGGSEDIAAAAAVMDAVMVALENESVEIVASGMDVS